MTNLMTNFFFRIHAFIISKCNHEQIQKILSGILTIFVKKLIHRGPYRSPLRSNWTRWVQLLLEGGSEPEFLRKPIATCYFPGVGRWGARTPCPPLPPSGSAHGNNDNESVLVLYLDHRQALKKAKKPILRCLNGSMWTCFNFLQVL